MRRLYLQPVSYTHLDVYKRQRLFWYHHIYQENTFSGPVAQLYKVKEIPATYFINPEGKIIMVNPDVEEIHDYLSNKVK